MRHARLLLLLCLFLPCLAGAGSVRAADMQFTTSDGVRLHFIEAGPRSALTIVLVPGWTMPAWIFKPQVDAWSARYHVVALDPRGQGYSEVPTSGYDAARRGRDIGELIASLGNKPVVLLGWSLGVLDSLAYVQQSGDGRLLGMVLVDNSVGEEPAPVAARAPSRRGPVLPREEQMRRFVSGMFARPPGAAYLQALTEAALNTPPDAAASLSNYGVPRTYWRDAIYSVRRPILYVVRPRFAGQAGNLAARHPMAESVVFEQAGHALFVDEAARFNDLVDGFIRRRIAP